MTEYTAKTFTWRPVDDKVLIHAGVLAGMTNPEEALFLNEIRQQMIYSIRTGVLSYDLPGHTAVREHTVIYRVPTSSWQMFKEEHQGAWWMRWLVTRRPVQKTTHIRRFEFEATWEDFVIYPWQQVAPTHPKLGSPVRHVQLVTQVNECPAKPETPETPEAPAEA